MTWRIDKRFDFCYGHRVWTQNLKDDYCAAGENQTKCKHMHGHEGSVHVFLESDKLDRGFVTDFKHLGWLKDLLNAYVDHKFVIDINDPAFSAITGGSLRPGSKLETASGSIIDLIPMAQDVFPNKTFGFVADTDGLVGWEQELVEGFLFINFVPTSENLSKWIFDMVDLKMHPLGVKVTQIDWYETPKSRSAYYVR